MPPIDPSTQREAEAARAWLLSLITDPKGHRYFVTKTPEQRLAELDEQLARTRHFLAFAGDPQQRYRAIHVAGTSGKGSVSVMLAAILQAGGIHNGLHTSPYLQVPNEKLVVDGTMISPADFAHQVAALRELHARWAAGAPWPALHYGEAWVALTFHYFAQAAVDWAVIETGLGGRYDPTNAIEGELAVITNIDYDHTNILGHTLEAIAGHKAGIIKPGALAVTGEQAPGPLAVIEAEARLQGAPLYRLGHEFSYAVAGDVLTVNAPYHRYSDLQVALKGVFQPLNAALAVAALDVLRERRGLAVDEDDVRTGLAAVRFPGRMEVMQEHPLVILDGAHNPAKMRSLAQSVEAAYPGRRVTALVGMLATKDAPGSLAALAPLVDRWVLTQPQVYGKPALSAEDLATDLAELGSGASVILEKDPMQALEIALKSTPKEDVLLLTGSIYLIGDLRARWFPIESLLPAEHAS